MKKYDIDLHSYHQGEWNALDHVLNLLNSIDTEGLTPDEVRRKIYGEVMKLRPSYGMHG